MSIPVPVGFWSYTHRDNDLDRGRVARLAQDIVDEYELQTGKPLRMFVDSISIEWGNEWRRNIDEALDGIVFFIAIITPLYLRSIACRGELMEFYKLFQLNSARRVVLPILYSDTPALSAPSSRDPIVQLVRRTQYQDFRKVRLSETHSSEYRRAVHGMATQIICICKR